MFIIYHTIHGVWTASQKGKSSIKYQSTHKLIEMHACMNKLVKNMTMNVQINSQLENPYVCLEFVALHEQISEFMTFLYLPL